LHGKKNEGTRKWMPKKPVEKKPKKNLRGQHGREREDGGKPKATPVYIQDTINENKGKRGR